MTKTTVKESQAEQDQHDLEAELRKIDELNDAEGSVS